MEIKELDIKDATTYQLISWNNYCCDLSKIIYLEVKQREAKVKALNLGYGEGIDAILKPTMKPPHRFDGDDWWPFLLFKLPC